MPFSTGCPARPILLRPKPHRMARNSTGSTWPSAKAPKKVSGTMCRMNSPKDVGGAVLAALAATDGSRWVGSMCMPWPGLMSSTAARPISSDRIVRT